MATLVDLQDVKDNLPAKVPSTASDPLIQQYINMAEGRVTVELQGLPEPGTDDAALMSSIVLDLATARSILKLFGQNSDMRDVARELRSGAEAMLEAFKSGGETPEDTIEEDLEEDYVISSLNEEYLFNYGEPSRGELSEDAF